MVISTRLLVALAALVFLATACSSDPPESLAFGDEPTLPLATFVELVERDFPNAAEALEPDLPEQLTDLATDICQVFDREDDLAKLQAELLALEPAGVFIEPERFAVFVGYAGGWRCPDVAGQVLRDDLSPE